MQGIDLHADTFQPRNGTQTSVLIVQKKTKEERDYELQTGTIKPYNIFMSIIEKVGHDKRGNTLFKRDDDGNEIWIPERENVIETERTASGDVAVTTENKTRIIDDQSKEVPALFEQWKKQEGISW